ncbi:zf-HC2 domain-containing protein [Streptomyces sp. NPDC007818]|uniref:zf-HC2 domain-containing protein n=1 Tax=Streptomyces sp. NPDC007818 TaxID=3364780 RepID=UPI0036763F42
MTTPPAPWHVTAALAARYAEGSAPEPDAWSLEKHVESCGPCAARVSAAVRATSPAGPALAALRADLLRAVGHRESLAAPSVTGPVPSADPGPATGPGPSAAPEGRRHARGWTFPAPVQRRQGRAWAFPAPAHRRHARAWASPARIWWAVGPALRGSWLAAVALVAGAAFALSHGAGLPAGRTWLLAAAPVLPLAGVAVSYGPRADPLHELAASTPAGGLRLLLTRTVAVLAVCVPLLTAAGALLPPAAGLPGAAAWLLPGLALTVGTLALGSFVGCRAAAATLGGGWLLAVTGPLLGPAASPSSVPLPYAAGPAAQAGWAAAALAGAALLALRRRSFDLLEPR